MILYSNLAFSTTLLLCLRVWTWESPSRRMRSVGFSASGTMVRCCTSRSRLEIGRRVLRDLPFLSSALATEDPAKVAKRYAKAGVLLPTVSDTPRTDEASITDYFVNFLKLKPQGEILESYVTIGNNWCQDVGIYEFTMGATGKKVRGRYSFVYGA